MKDEKIPPQTKDKICRYYTGQYKPTKIEIETAEYFDCSIFKAILIADYCLDLSIQAMNEYMNDFLCTKSIPMPKADSNSIAESINKYLKT